MQKERFEEILSDLYLLVNSLVVELGTDSSPQTGHVLDIAEDAQQRIEKAMLELGVPEDLDFEEDYVDYGAEDDSGLYDDAPDFHDESLVDGPEDWD